VPNVAQTKARQGTAKTQGAPRSKKGQQTRERLVEASKKVFERDGFLEARIVDIAEEANLAPGGFYHYFDSKEQLFLEVAQRQEERLTAPPDGASAPSDISPMDRIRRANRLYLERYREEAALMGVIEQVSRYDEDVNAARMATMKHFVERAERSIRGLQKEGYVDARLSPSMTADALGAMVARVAELWLVQGYREYDFEKAVEQLSILWANALGIPEHKPGRKRSGKAVK
jgi:AcrR family transcriptional regulator